MKIIRINAFILILSIFRIYAANSADFELSGFVDTYHAAAIECPNDMMSSRTRLRGEIQAYEGDSYIFASFNANHNYLLEDQTFIELREAFLEYAEEAWDIRAGRQIIVWGKADGLRITDLISPMDMTEFLARDYDDIRIPVDALKFRWMPGDLSLEFVFVPIFQKYIIPKNPENPWAFLVGDETTRLVWIDAAEPSRNLSNSEFGGRLSFFLSGVDFSLLALHTWNKMPNLLYDFKAGNEKDTMFINTEYHRLTAFGINVSKPLGEFVLRGEAAFYPDKKFDPDQYGDEVIGKSSINYLIGLDWYPGDEWTVSIQLSDEYIPDYDIAISAYQHTSLSTISASKKLLRNTLTISSFAYIGLNNFDIFDRTMIEYALSDQIHVMAGLDIFAGDKGLFGSYKDNSEFWIKAKYSF